MRGQLDKYDKYALRWVNAAGDKYGKFSVTDRSLFECLHSRATEAVHRRACCERLSDRAASTEGRHLVSKQVSK